jgi:hypothetical protein
VIADKDGSTELAEGLDNATVAEEGVGSYGGEGSKIAEDEAEGACLSAFKEGGVLERVIVA